MTYAEVALLDSTVFQIDIDWNASSEKSQSVKWSNLKRLKRGLCVSQIQKYFIPSKWHDCFEHTLSMRQRATALSTLACLRLKSTQNIIAGPATEEIQLLTVGPTRTPKVRFEWEYLTSNINLAPTKEATKRLLVVCF